MHKKKPVVKDKLPETPPPFVPDPSDVRAVSLALMANAAWYANVAANSRGIEPIAQAATRDAIEILKVWNAKAE